MGMHSRKTWRLRSRTVAFNALNNGIWPILEKKQTSVFRMKFSVPIRRRASAWKNRVLTVGDDDRNEVFTAELSVLILLKMIESIDMTLCVISFLVYSKIRVYTGIYNFLVFALKHRLWVLVRTQRVHTIYVLSKNKKIFNFCIYLFHFYCHEKSLYIAWTCFRNVSYVKKTKTDDY